MISFLSRLFGSGGDDKASKSEPIANEPVHYKDCIITIAPQNEGGQWRVAGSIARAVEGELITRQFIRADLCMSRDEAAEVSQRKGQQIIDQNPRLFADPTERGPV